MKMKMPSSLMVPAWGIAPTENVPIAWGARAIYSLRSGPMKRVGRKIGGKTKYFNERSTLADIDLVFNRKDCVGDEALKPALYEALDTFLLSALRKQCEVQYLTPDSSDTIEIVEGGYKIVASPKASHGYLYIGAWPVPVKVENG